MPQTTPANIPLWLPVTLAFLDFIIPAAILLLGLFVIRKNWKNRHPSQFLRCAKCQYDMRASLNLTCPDCGHTHKNKAQLQPVSLWPQIRVILSILFCIPSLWVLFFCLWYYPQTYIKNQQSHAFLASLTTNPDIHIINASASNNHVRGSMPSWTFYLCSLGTAVGGPNLVPPGKDLQTFYYVRDLSAPPGIPLFHTLCSWTWHPSLNYIAYLPDDTITSLTLQSRQISSPSASNQPPPTPIPLSLFQAQTIAQIPDLQFLNLDESIQVDDQALAQFARMASSPAQFYVNNYKPDPTQSASWDGILRLEGPTSLYIKGGAPSLAFFKILNRSVNIQSLYFYPSPSAQPATQPAISDKNQPTLAEGLKLLDPRHLEAFFFNTGSPQDRLEAFRLISRSNGVFYILIFDLDVSPDEFLLLNKQSDIQSLNLSFAPGSRINDSHLHTALTGLSNLNQLALSNLPQVRGDFLKSLPQSVQSITLENIPLQDASLIFLYRDDLYELTLKKCPVTFISLKNLLLHTHKLDSLTLDHPVDLDYCQALIKHPNLSEVTLDSVDDACLDVLLKSPGLQSINLTNNRLSPARLAQIQSQPQSANKYIAIIPDK